MVLIMGNEIKELNADLRRHGFLATEMNVFNKTNTKQKEKKTDETRFI